MTHCVPDKAPLGRRRSLCNEPYTHLGAEVVKLKEN